MTTVHTNREAFRKWCAARGYAYDDIPGPNIRNRPGWDLLPDDADGRWVAAYNEFINEATADTVKYFAAVVKGATHRRSLVGTFFAYVVLLAGENRQSDSGQLFLRDLLESEDVDFVCGVPTHLLRSYTGENYGYPCQPTAIASVLAHGRQYADDNDIFSWLHQSPWHTDYDPKDPRGGAISMHRRWLALESVLGNSYEWFSLFTTWHHDEQLLDDYALEARIHQDSLKLDRTPVEEIAFVVDDHTFSWLTPSAQSHYAGELLLATLGRTGAPVGVWRLSDVDRLPGRIKCVVVVNASAPRAEDLKKLKHLIARGGRTIMLVGTPGLVDSKTQRWNPAGLEDLLGMPIRLDDEAKTARADLIATGEHVCVMNRPLPGLESDAASIRPRAYLAGAGFMKYEDGKTAGAERPLANGGRLIWCGVPPYASESWVRKLVETAGVHCYAPTPCAVYASKELVSVTSYYEDDRNVDLTWPQDVQVTDLFDGWHGRGKSISCPFKHGQTRLFRVNDE